LAFIKLPVPATLFPLICKHVKPVGVGWQRTSARIQDHSLATTVNLRYVRLTTSLHTSKNWKIAKWKRTIAEWIFASDFRV
jgi:hypothetical protein